MYENLGYPRPCITSLHGFWLQSWTSFIPDLYEGCYMTWMMLWHKYMMFYSEIFFPILCGSKYNKSICETLAFTCHWITSFHDFGFNLEGVLYQFVWGILSEYYDFLRAIYDVLLYNLIYLCSVGWNPYVKLLHSHAIESLVSMTLASILKEYCIRFVGEFFIEFYAVWEYILILYITSMFHITLRTIYYTFPMSKSS